MSTGVLNGMVSCRLLRLLGAFWALCVTGACAGSAPPVMCVEELGYDVLGKVQSLSLEPERLEIVERKVDPLFGVLVDEAHLSEEGAIVAFLPDSGTLISFRRDIGKLHEEEIKQSLDKKMIHSKAVAVLQGLGIEALTAGENVISEDDWVPCKSEIVPSSSQEEVLDSWCLSKTLSYRGIPSVSSFVSMKLDGKSGKPIQLTYIPAIEIKHLEPEISSDTAKEAADALVRRLGGKGMRYDASRLVIASPNNEFSRERDEQPKMELFDQRLAWEVRYHIEKLGHEHHVRIYVDAMTGAVIGG